MPDAVSTLRSAENNAIAQSEPSYYTGNGRSADTGRSKAKGKKKRTWIVAIILTALLGGGGAFLSMSHTLFPFQLSANILSTVDTQAVATKSAFNRIFKGFLRGDEASVTVPTSEFPDALVTRMKGNNFTVDGNNVTWTDTINNTTTTVTASNYDSLYYDNALFRSDVDNLTYNRAGNFYDNGALDAYDNIGESRNVFHNYKQTGNMTTDMDAFDTTMYNSFESGSTSLRSYIYGTEEKEITVKDEDGNTHTEIVYEPKEYNEGESIKPNGDSTWTSSMDTTSIRSAINKLTTVGNATGAVCAAMQIGTMFVSAVAGLETYYVLRYALELLENVSKTQNGYGDGSAIHAFMQHITTNTENAIIPDYSSATYNNVVVNNNGTSGSIEITSEEDVSGAGIEDANLRSIVSGTPASKSAAKNFSVERLAVALGGALTLGAGAARSCAFAAAATNTLSLVSIGLSIGSGGIIGVGTYIINKFFTLGVFRDIAISFIIGLAVPAFVNLLANFFTQTVGKAIGAQTVSGIIPGISNLLGKGVSGQTISSPQAVQAFNRENQTLIALEAEVDRLNHSPFDITNGNTFLGSIARQFSTLMYSSSISKITSLMQTTSTSLASLVGRVSASGEDSSYLTTNGDCPMVESVGGAGDVYCHPITVSDVNTFDIDYNDQTYVEVITDNTIPHTENGVTTYEVAPNSNLARYIAFCNGRESMYGVTDYNILNANNIGNVVTNSTPVVSNAIGALNSLDVLLGNDGNSFAWATGEICGNTEDNQEFWQEEGQYFQTYVNAQRVYSQTGAYDDTDNPVYAYQEKYNAEHPKDNSLQGVIARYSGLTTEDTEVVLAFAEYYQFLDDYDATTRIAMDGEITITLTSKQAVAKIERGAYKDLQESTVNESADIRIVASEFVIYADIRNRSYAIC